MRVTPSGPGAKYIVSPIAPLKAVPAESGSRESLTAGGLFLLPRDPRCLYVHWDIPAGRQRVWNQLSIDGHLVVRIRLNQTSGEVLAEIHVHPESRHWFVHLPQAGEAYVAELGYYGPGRVWNHIAVSERVPAPAAAVAQDRTLEFATIPLGLPLPAALPAPSTLGATGPTQLASGQAGSPVPSKPPAVSATGTPADASRAPGQHDTIPVASANVPGVPPSQAPAAGKGASPPFPAASGRAEQAALWTPEQEQLLVEMATGASSRREVVGSLEIEHLIRPEAGPAPEAEVQSMGVPVLERLIAQAPEAAVSSPMGPAGIAAEGAPGRRFWFSVNAELVVYGATEPDATVTIGDRQIRLRPDGSFSYRFALPDGVYDLPVAATSTDGESRRVRLTFSRKTLAEGEVTVHPQDPALKAPSPGNVT